MNRVINPVASKDRAMILRTSKKVQQKEVPIPQPHKVEHRKAMPILQVHKAENNRERAMEADKNHNNRNRIHR
jgi:hypothetical protein